MNQDDCMEHLQLGELAAIGTACLWTLSALAWTSSGRYLGALPVSFIRLLIACVYLSLYGLLFRGLPLPLDASANTWLLVGASGFFGFFIADLCLFKSFLLIGPRLSLLLQTFSPPLAQIIYGIFIGEGLPVRSWIGMGVTLSGVVWVLLESPATPRNHEHHAYARRGIALALISAFSASVGTVLAKIGIGDYNAVAATHIRALGAIVGYIGLVTISRHWPAVLKSFTHRRGMSIVMFGCFVGPFLGMILFMVALRETAVGVVYTIVNTTPVLILPFVIVLYHEKVSPRAAFGAVLAVVGVAVLVL
ncbi:MAG: DMT family transporter [Thermoguttaceae bacterium]